MFLGDSLRVCTFLREFPGLGPYNSYVDSAQRLGTAGEEVDGIEDD